MLPRGDKPTAGKQTIAAGGNGESVGGLVATHPTSLWSLCGDCNMAECFPRGINPQPENKLLLGEETEKVSVVW